ncbi:UPF0481 protein [Cinnamomum micranthum f. kanehirae]|uniref:UPF0481 protein n=1 Tax=Cinnamomum micranthum f. kanehirae TaxID=337451 RepID=A0A3S3PJK5_9MAGN|nr:UPF0481 protein [Cinnamomum micranthum f. kanehirae]
MALCASHHQSRRNRNGKLSHYLKQMKGLEVEVRSFYSENIEMESKEFVEMMLLDGCFIVELFLNLKDRNATAETDDPIYSTEWILPIIRLDMLLLENQLPFLVVKHIFQLVKGADASFSLLVELALRFFEHLMPMKKEISSPISVFYSKNSIHHLLQLYHLHLIPTTLQSDTTDQGGNAAVAIYPDNIPVPPPPQSDTTDQGGNAAVAIYPDNIPVPPPPQSDTTDQGGNAAVAIYEDNRPVPPPRSIMSASDLRHFLRLTKKENASSIVEVELKGGRLEIPTLWINHSTNSILRNLIAWELCYPKCGTQFTSYAFFMDCLIDSPKDVAILKDLNIIEHWLGNNEAVALLFNQMCIGLYLPRSHYALMSFVFQIEMEFS